MEINAAEACLYASAIGVIISLGAGRLVRRSEVRILKNESAAREHAAAAATDIANDTSPHVGDADLVEGAVSDSALAVAPAPEIVVRVTKPTEEESRELRASREVQRALLPSTPRLSGYHIDAVYQPCGALGGDFYDFHPYPDGRLLVTVGDVSGKGPAGAIVMAMVQTLFRNHAPSVTSPAELLVRVNDGFAGVLGKGVFVTAAAGILDPAQHTFTLATAGHPPLLLLNAQKRRAVDVQARGTALGIVRGAGFAQSLVETSVDIAPNDSLLFFTDGATEGEEELSHGTGEHRFRAAAAAAILPGNLGALKRLQTELSDGSGRRDDLTLLLVTRLSADEKNLAGSRARGSAGRSIPVADTLPRIAGVPDLKSHGTRG